MRSRNVYHCLLYLFIDFNIILSFTDTSFSKDIRNIHYVRSIYTYYTYAISPRGNVAVKLFKMAKINVSHCTQTDLNDARRKTVKKGRTVGARYTERKKRRNEHARGEARVREHRDASPWHSGNSRRTRDNEGG